jgi:hypothetical protein
MFSKTVDGPGDVERQTGFPNARRTGKQVGLCQMILGQTMPQHI